MSLMGRILPDPYFHVVYLKDFQLRATNLMDADLLERYARQILDEKKETGLGFDVQVPLIGVIIVRVIRLPGSNHQTVVTGMYPGVDKGKIKLDRLALMMMRSYDAPLNWHAPSYRPDNPRERKMVNMLLPAILLGNFFTTLEMIGERLNKDVASIVGAYAWENTLPGTSDWFQSLYICVCKHCRTQQNCWCDHCKIQRLYK